MDQVHARLPAHRLLLAVSLALACARSGDFRVPAALPGAGELYDPSRALGSLFHDVQLARAFPDSKTFVDAEPLAPPAVILARYRNAADSNGFGLRSFVERNFRLPANASGAFRADTAQPLEAHLRALWPVLTRPPDSTVEHSSFYLSRSQPPFFAAMVALLAAATDTASVLDYLPSLEAEHAFWMAGAESVSPGEASRRVVRLEDGALLNRYWDDRPEPRPERTGRIRRNRWRRTCARSGPCSPARLTRPSSTPH